MKIKLFSSEDYGCLMMYLRIPKWDLISSMIDPKDLNIEEGGLENEPHITIIYGLIDSEINLDEVTEDASYLYHNYKIRLNNLSLFENDKCDVLKFDVDDHYGVFEKFHKFFKSNYPNVQTFEDYKPHCTVAYLNKGEGKKYLGKIKEVICNSKYFVYSNPKMEKVIIK
jgi:hypothetical protein